MEIIEQAKLLYAGGHSYNAISKELNLSYHKVISLLDPQKAKYRKMQSKANYQKNRLQKLAYVEQYKKTHKSPNIEVHKKNFLNNHPDYFKRWRTRNHIKFISQIKANRKLRYHTDSNFRLRTILRSRIRSAIKRAKACKKLSSIELLGCDYNTFKAYIESKFLLGMTWDNYGLWEIDHIKPCCSFDLTQVNEQKLCFNFMNLQPIWKEIHKVKSVSDRQQSILHG